MTLCCIYFQPQTLFVFSAEPEYAVLRYCKDFHDSTAFQGVVACCILCNLGSLLAEHDRQTERVTHVLGAPKPNLKPNPNANPNLDRHCNSH